MNLNNLTLLFTRDIIKVKTEIESYRMESNLWRVEGEITNSGGTLCMHLIGNLNAYIGVGLALTDYVRDRKNEFAGEGVSRTTLLQQLDDTLAVVTLGLSNLEASQLQDPFPIDIWDEPTEMEFTLLHLLTHLNYHLGQINYHRRLIDVPTIG